MTVPSAELLNQLVAGQAATDQRFEELFRRLDGAEKTAGEARDIAKEIATILREQNALARVAEVRAEAHQIVNALRADVVKANTSLKADIKVVSDDVKVVSDDVATLKAGKAEQSGMLKGGKALWEVAKFLVAAGAGGLILKLMEG